MGAHDYLMMVDGKVQTVDLSEMIGRHRRAHIKARAAITDQAADLFGDSAFDPMETWDAGLAAGLTDANMDAAAHIAVTLREIELDGP